MRAQELLNRFRKLDSKEQQKFLSGLMMWNDLHLPDSRFMILTIEQYRSATEDVQIAEVPALYDVARQICHASGCPWTDPRDGKTYPAPKGKRRR